VWPQLQLAIIHGQFGGHYSIIIGCTFNVCVFPLFERYRRCCTFTFTLNIRLEHERAVVGGEQWWPWCCWVPIRWRWWWWAVGRWPQAVFPLWPCAVLAVAGVAQPDSVVVAVVLLAKCWPSWLTLGDRYIHPDPTPRLSVVPRRCDIRWVLLDCCPMAMAGMYSIWEIRDVNGLGCFYYNVVCRVDMKWYCCVGQAWCYCCLLLTVLFRHSMTRRVVPVSVVGFVGCIQCGNVVCDIGWTGGTYPALNTLPWTTLVRTLRWVVPRWTLFVIIGVILTGDCCVFPFVDHCCYLFYLFDIVVTMPPFRYLILPLPVILLFCWCFTLTYCSYYKTLLMCLLFCCSIITGVQLFPRDIVPTLLPDQYTTHYNRHIVPFHPI